MSLIETMLVDLVCSNQCVDMSDVPSISVQMQENGTNFLYLPLSHSRDLNFNNLMTFPRAIEALPKLKELWV